MKKFKFLNHDTGKTVTVEAPTAEKAFKRLISTKAGKKAKWVLVDSQGKQNPEAEYEPEEEDIFFHDQGLSAGGKFLGNFTEYDEARKVALEWCEKHQFWPNAWIVSDHGNYHLIEKFYPATKRVKKAKNPGLDHMTLGTTPTDEKCAQVGDEGYAEKAKKEAKAYTAQLVRELGTPPEGAFFKLKGFPHDFGTYYEVCIMFDPDVKEAVDYAYKAEANMPARWDEEAKLGLGLRKTRKPGSDYKPKHLELWKHPENYAGETYEEYYVGPSQSRDSDALTRSNFRVALDRLGGESEGEYNPEEGEFPEVIHTRSGHWAVGWVESILVHKDATEKVKILDEIARALQNYPVLDDSDFSELEQEEADETWENNASSFIGEVAEYLEIEDYADLPKEEQKELEEIAHSVFDEDRSYSGSENAWVSERSIERFGDSIAYGYPELDARWAQNKYAVQLAKEAAKRAEYRKAAKIGKNPKKATKRDFDYQYCWTGITKKGALVGGYESSLEATEKHRKFMKNFSAGATPVDLLMSLRHSGHITDDQVLEAMKTISRKNPQAKSPAQRDAKKRAERAPESPAKAGRLKAAAGGAT